MALHITITDAGRAEIINADNTGTGPVVITEIGFGTGQYNPAKDRTALQAEVKRVSSIAGQAVADDTIHVIAKDETSAAYNVGEFGLFSASGTLVAVYSQTAAFGWIIQKASASTLLLATDIILESIDAASLTFGDITFLNPPATESTPGVTKLVDNLTSSDTTSALTAAQGKQLNDNKQPKAATLTALAALVVAANKMIYATGPDTFSTTDLSPFARTFLDDANAEAALQTLGAAPLASPAFTGTPSAPTAVAGSNNTQLATTAFVAAVKTLLDAAIALKAPLQSPALTGTPTAPTAAQATNNTQLATTAFVKAAVAALVDSSPGTLNTLNELAAALGDDPNFATTMATALAAKADKATTLAGYGITDALRFKINSELENPAVSWNTFVNEGLHPKIISGNNPDGPGPALYFYCRTYVRIAVAGDGSGALQQFAEPYGSPFNSGQMLWRGLNGVNWTPWVKVISSSDLATQDEAENGTSNDRWMSVLRVFQLMVKYGLGAATAPALGSVNDTSTASGLYQVASAATGLPIAEAGFVDIRRGGAGLVSQRYFSRQSRRAFFRSGNGALGPWDEFWHSGNFTPAELAPPGVVAHFARNSAPSGWLKANGAEVSRTSYAALFAAIGTTFGAGNGSTTFRLPDMRGEFGRGWDDARGVDLGRVFGSSQRGSLITFDPTTAATALTGLHSTGSDSTTRTDVGLDNINPADYPGIDAASVAASSTLTSSTAIGVSRPRNVALLYCIKY